MRCQTRLPAVKFGSAGGDWKPIADSHIGMISSAPATNGASPYTVPARSVFQRRSFGRVSIGSDSTSANRAPNSVP
jgi:hypothetical protein